MEMECLKKYDITKERGNWNGFQVWYVKPRPCIVSSEEALPSFLLFDGLSYRYATQPNETQDIIKSFSKDTACFNF